MHGFACRAAAAALAAGLLAGCASLSEPPNIPPEAWTEPPSGDPGHARSQGWEHFKLPGKTPNRFQFVRKDGRNALAVQAQASVSMKRQTLFVPAAELGAIRFSWNVPSLIAQADMARRELDDSPVRVVLVFEGDRSRFSARDAVLSELARALTGEEMPYATLMYVWCNQRAPGEVIVNPRTGRIRKMVVESGASNLGRWLDYERDIRADYERAFGEPPGALLGVGLMTDTDNTRSQARAWYGPVRLQGAAGAASEGVAGKY